MGNRKLHRMHTDQPYAFARWKRCRVAPDYHVEVEGHWHSTPYRLIRELVDVRIADNTRRDLQIFHKGQRIASHARAPNRRGHTTIADPDIIEIASEPFQDASAQFSAGSFVRAGGR